MIPYHVTKNDFILFHFSVDNVTHDILNNANNKTVPDFKMRTSFLRCRVWESDKEKWSKDICKVMKWYLE